MTRILIIDDSKFVHRILTSVLEAEDDIEIVGHAYDGAQGVKLHNEIKPDVVVMDVEMPVMDGLEATRRIMGETPKPVVIFSSAGARVSNLAFKSLGSGAVDLVEKPDVDDADSLAEVIREKLVNKLRLYTGLQVVRRIKKELIHNLEEHGKKLGTRVDREEVSVSEKPVSSEGEYAGMVVAIAASTGGPKTLRDFLATLPDPLPWPVVILQHMSTGFFEGFREWISQGCRAPVEFMKAGCSCLPGTVYIATGGQHWGVGGDGKFVAVDGDPVFGIRPCADVLFTTMAEVYRDRLVGIVLTGMGHDGKMGASAIKKAGGHIVAQHQDGCILFGMPKAVIEADLADSVLRIGEISEYLVSHSSTING